MLLQKLKELGKGTILVINGRIVYIDFTDLESVSETPFLKIDGNKVFELMMTPTPTKNNPNHVSIIISKLSETLFQSKYLLINLSKISNLEIIDENSELYKIIVKKRSNIILAHQNK